MVDAGKAFEAGVGVDFVRCSICTEISIESVVLTIIIVMIQLLLFDLNTAVLDTIFLLIIN